MRLDVVSFMCVRRRRRFSFECRTIFLPCVGRFFSHVLDDFSPMCGTIFLPCVGRFFSLVLDDFSPMCWTIFLPCIGRFFSLVLDELTPACWTIFEIPRILQPFSWSYLKCWCLILLFNIIVLYKSLRFVLLSSRLNIC